MCDWITGVIARLGYLGVAILTFLENIFPPMPSEVVIPLTGFVAAQGDLRIGVVIATGTLGSLGAPPCGTRWGDGSGRSVFARGWIATENG
jgi:membrane protein DedA with SNARE-associated domain